MSMVPSSLVRSNRMAVRLGSHRFLVSWSLVCALLVASCGGDDGDTASAITSESASQSGVNSSEAPTSSTAPAPEESEPLRLSSVCGDVLDSRDITTTLGARDAAVEVIGSLVEADPEPDAAQRAAWAQALTAHRDQLLDAREQLAAVEVSAPAAWNMLVVVGDGEMNVLGERAALLGADTDGETVRTSWTTPTPAEEVTDETLEALGMWRGDCAFVWLYPGNPAEDAEFVSAASSLCRVVADRRAQWRRPSGGNGTRCDPFLG